MSLGLRGFLARFALLAAAGLALGAAAHAQSQIYGAIGGAVTDPQDAAVVEAAVSARSLATSAVSETKTDSGGRYLIINLPPGKYELVVRASGFSEFKQNIIAEVGLVTTVDVKLALAGQASQVVVSSEAPVVDTQQGSYAANFNQEDVQNLPLNQRRWSYFAVFTPGTVPDGTFGDIAFRGVGYVFDNNTVDGGANTQAFFAEEVGRTRMAYSTSLNSVQEFQVSTSAYSAEYGRAVGGVINAVTKSGTNELHGSLFYYNRDNAIGGAFAPFATAAQLQSSGSYVVVPIKPVDIRQQFGGDAGGWLIKNKLFWYFNIDAQIRHFPITDIPTTPNNFFTAITVAAPPAPNTCANATLSGSGAPKYLNTGQILFCRGFTQAELNSAVTFLDSTTGTAPRTGDQLIYFPKIDWKPTDKDTVTFFYNRVRWKSPFGVQTGSVVARSIDSDGNDFVHDERAGATWSTAYGTNITNVARFVYSKDDEFEFTTPSLPGEPISPLTGLSPQVDINGCGFKGVTMGTATTTLACGWTIGAPYYLQRPAYPNELRYQAADTFGLNWGRHLFRMGVDISHVGDALTSYASGDQLGEYSYTYLQDYLSDYMTYINKLPAQACTSTSGGMTYQIPCYNDYFQTFGPLSFNVATVESAFFFQDDWRINSRFTVNLGLRFDHESLPHPVVPNLLLPESTNFRGLSDLGTALQPRAGFAWDIFGRGKLALRGGYGWYLGRITNEQIYEELTLTGSPAGQLSPTIFPTTGSSNSTGLPTPGEPLYPNILPTYNASVGTPNVVYFPSDLRLPGADEYDLALEYEVARDTALSVSYIGSIGRFLPIGLDTNLPKPTTLSYTIVGGPLAGQVVTVPFFAGKRPNTSYQKIVEYCSCVTSHYNGLVADFKRRYAYGLQFDLSYTYASATDDGASSSAAITSNGPVNPYNLGAEEGRSYLEVRHRFVGTVVWRPPYFEKSSNAFKRNALGGWQISMIEVAQSGLPLQASVSGNEPSGLGATVSAGGITGGNTATRVPFVPKNDLFLPPTVNTDLRLSRLFHIYERSELEFSVEAFNLFNHVDFTSATTTLYTTGGTAAAPTLTYSTSYGARTAANNSVFFTARQLQFGARFYF